MDPTKRSGLLAVRATRVLGRLLDLLPLPRDRFPAGLAFASSVDIWVHTQPAAPARRPAVRRRPSMARRTELAEPAEQERADLPALVFAFLLSLWLVLAIVAIVAFLVIADEPIRGSTEVTVFVFVSLFAGFCLANAVLGSLLGRYGAALSRHPARTNLGWAVMVLFWWGTLLLSLTP